MQKKLIGLFAFAIFVLIVGWGITPVQAHHNPGHSGGPGGGEDPPPPPQLYIVTVAPNDGQVITLSAAYNGTKSAPTTADGDDFGESDWSGELLDIGGMKYNGGSGDSIDFLYNRDAGPHCDSPKNVPDPRDIPGGVASTDWEISVSPESIMWIGLIFEEPPTGATYNHRYFLRLLGELSENSLPPPGVTYDAPITDWKIYLMDTKGNTRCNWGVEDAPLMGDNLGTISICNDTDPVNPC